MKKTGRIAVLAAGLVLCAGSAAWAAPDVPASRPRGLNDPGVQLSRTRQYLQWQQALQRMEEGRGTEPVEGETAPPPEKEGPSLRFVLQGVTTDPSDVLAEEDIRAAAAPYVGREITLDDLYALVADLNALYTSRGYLTCRAYLAPQTIRGGVVHISLVEGRTGSVTVEGNRATNESYIRHRMSLAEGTVANIHSLNRDLLRFNATNDAQLRIVMRAGAEPGTTDYLIAAYEPQKEIFGLFSDNAGSRNSGLYRGGLFWQDRSLTGRRDSLMMTTVFSEGTKSFGAAYTTPISSIGAKLGLTYSANSVHIVDGPLEPLDVRGHASSYGISLTRPLVTTETVKSEIGIEYSRQHSRTDFMGLKWVDDTVDGVSLFYDQIDYGRTSLFYQRHAYRFGDFDTLSEDESQSFGKYTLNTLYQKAYHAGQMLTARVDGQLSSTTYLPSAEQFYLGGVYSVRGYTESLLSGESGVMGSVEYAVPVTPDRRTSVFLFLDGGTVWGDSAYGDRTLAGAGFGVKSNVTDHIYFNVSMGFPLIRTINDEEQSRARVHFSFNSQF